MSGTKDQQLSRGALVALVVGSMVGSGIFTLPSAFGRTTGVLGALIAWCIAGAGMLMLAFVFQTLSRRRPDLDAGIYAYAKAGFGSYLGFVSAFGYWIACCLADVACLILIKATLGQFFPVFGDGTTAVAIVSASVLLWGVHVLVLRGVREAAALNTIATVAKMVPIVIFIAVVIAGFKADVFALNFWGDAEHSLYECRRTRCATRCSSPCSCSSASRAPASIRATRRTATTSVSPPSSASWACCACWCWSPCSPMESCCARTLRRWRIRRWPA